MQDNKMQDNTMQDNTMQDNIMPDNTMQGNKMQGNLDGFETTVKWLMRTPPPVIKQSGQMTGASS